MDAFERLIAIADRRHIDGFAALDHNDLEAELASGCDLPVGRRSAAVLGDDHVDAALCEQIHLVGLGKRAGGKDSSDVGEGEWWRHRIDAAHDIAVLRRPLKMEGLLPADRQEDAARFLAEGLHGLRHICHTRPAIARPGLPGRPSQSKERRSATRRCRGSVVGNAGGVGMRRIDEQRDTLFPQEGGKPLRAAKTADARGQGLWFRIGRAPGKRDRRIVPPIDRETFPELPRFGGSAQNQDARSARG